jgi:hypothetical protein
MSMDPHQLGRRDLLAATTATTAPGAGCLGESSQPTERPSETTFPDRSPAAHEPQASGRIGDAVFYDPSGDDHYDDGQAALADVPVGGTFVIGHGVWDVAEEGRLVVEKTVNIRGMGWASPKEEPGGTRIVNTGEDAIDKPAVEFRGPSEPADDNPRMLGSLRDVQIEHEGNSSAVLLRRAIRTVVADCLIDCRNAAPRGLVYGTWAFFARAYRNKIVSATDVCVYVGGNGYAHEFYSNHIATGVDGATAFQTTRPRTILVGGECASTGSEGVAIAFRGVLGGYVVEPGIEATDTGIVVGRGDGRMARQVRLYHVTLPLDEGQVGVRFDNARGGQLIDPVTYSSEGRGHLIEWTERAEHCGVRTEATAIEGQQYRDHGALNPSVSIEGGLTPEYLENLPTGVPTSVDYYTGTGGPVFHDGTGWKRVAAEGFDPSTG